MKLFTDVNFPTEIQDVAKLFFADVLLCSPEQAECSLTHTCADGVYTYVAQALGQSAVRSVRAEGDGLQSVRLQKRYAKLAMYEALCRGTGKILSGRFFHKEETCPQCEGSGRVTVGCEMTLDIRPYKPREERTEK